MKNIKYLILSVLASFAISSCAFDNYDEPHETLQGKITDSKTKEPFQAGPGGSGVKLVLMEYSWSDQPVPYTFNSMMDGTYKNTKIFKGEYGVRPVGAFVPVAEKKVKIEGTTTLDFEVDPFLRIEWVGEPKVNADGTVDVKVKINRGTNDPAYQQPLTDVWFFLTENIYVGDNNYNPKLSTHFAGAQINSQIGNGSDIIGKTITLRSGQPNGKDPGAAQNFTPEYSRKYFLRVAARIDKDVEGAKVLNYSTMKEITTIAR